MYAQCTVAVLLQTKMPDNLEPCQQRRVGVLEHRAGLDGCHVVAFPALDLPLGQSPKTTFGLAHRADKAVRPAILVDILQAGCIVFKGLIEHASVDWVCVHAHTLNVKSVASS